MINEILRASGLPYRESQFLHPPAGTFAVYLHDVSASGSDGAEVLELTHNLTVELYEPKPDDAAEAAMEAAIQAAGLAWTKQTRYWLQNVQRYQVIYEFSYYTKRRT